jgi:predicted SnoaL-like aldol condensation-catalyzing enzyme
MKHAIAIIALVSVAACGENPPPTTEPTPAKAEAPSAPAIPVVALSETDKARIEAAKSSLPADASVVQAIIDGDVAILIYTSGGGLSADMVRWQPDGTFKATQVRQANADLTRVLAGMTASTARFDTAQETANKQTVQAFIEATNRPAKPDAAGALLDAAYVDHAEADPPGPSALLARLASAETAARFIAPQGMAAQRDLVGVLSTVETTAPSAQPTYSVGFDLFRVAGGKVVERWRVNY